jgi:hypothetical protein
MGNKSTSILGLVKTLSSKSWPFYFSFLILLFFSCEKGLDIDLPYDGDKLVIWGLLSPDRVVSIQLNKTYPPTGKSLFIDGIANATVTLYENDVLVQQLVHKGSGVYSSPTNFKPKSGKTYAIKATASGFPALSTLPETIPSPFFISRLEVGQLFDSPVSSSTKALPISITWTDVANQENFYSILPQSYIGTQRFGGSFDIDTPSELDVCGFSFEPSVYNLSDKCFPNGTYTKKIGVNFSYASVTDKPLNDPLIKNLTQTVDRIYILFRHVSKNYYQYMYSGNQPEIVLLAFASGYPRHTNVVGGYGLLASYNEQKITAL